jgi:phthalate 4,5-dioxygenase oxygenase subunit
VPKKNMQNDYMLDRELQKTLSYTGIAGVSDQDAAIQDSQGAIQDRTKEHLGPTDVGIVEFRKLVMSAARALQRGDAPRAANASQRYAVRAGGWIAAGDKDIGTVMLERFGHRDGYIGTEYGLAE